MTTTTRGLLVAAALAASAGGPAAGAAPVAPDTTAGDPVVYGCIDPWEHADLILQVASVTGAYIGPGLCA